ncbi:hypothetical protein [Amycolatopsis sp. H20-H5]|uniref:hypothetical protein n=1 Tax=Amycolatopsis sp. H20-H5 TaxID=3046309 RepID=UPI002DBF4E33|nr:hypothetical protein [Amycolatopsis sp. H20-H5]MEC3977242.1 hypothetical protein [Amycolatopsis sp. H20-H5]
MRSSFATVPLYRERWALDGREDPVVVKGRTGSTGGALPAEEAVRKLVDLVPLAGGAATSEPCRGLGRVLRIARPVAAGDVVVVLDPRLPRPPAYLPPGVRGCVLDPDSPPDTALSALVNTLRGNGTVVAVGQDKTVAAFAATLPDELVRQVAAVPHRELDSLDNGPFGVLHDPLLGYLGAFGECGRWHLDWTRVYARSTSAGLVFTLLRQHSPRLVDVVVAGGVRGTVEPCPRHGTPVVLT